MVMEQTDGTFVARAAPDESVGIDYVEDTPEQAQAAIRKKGRDENVAFRWHEHTPNTSGSWLVRGVCDHVRDRDPGVFEGALVWRNGGTSRLRVLRVRGGRGGSRACGSG